MTRHMLIAPRMCEEALRADPPNPGRTATRAAKALLVASAFAALPSCHHLPLPEAGGSPDSESNARPTGGWIVTINREAVVASLDLEDGVQIEVTCATREGVTNEYAQVRGVEPPAEPQNARVQLRAGSATYCTAWNDPILLEPAFPGDLMGYGPVDQFLSAMSSSDSIVVEPCADAPAGSGPVRMLAVTPYRPNDVTIRNNAGSSVLPSVRFNADGTLANLCRAGWNEE